MTNRNRNILALLGWLGLTFGLTAWGALLVSPAWYQELNRPPWSPPPWVFGPVWTMLYAAMSVAAWLVWMRGGWKAQGGPLGRYVIQLVLNALWTPIFFGLRRPGWALTEILILWLAIVLTLVSFWRARASAGALFAPYLAWVTFAAALNFAIWQRQ